MPRQTVAGRTFVGVSHPFLTLNRGEIRLNQKIFRNGQGAKRGGADGYRCNRRKIDLGSGDVGDVLQVSSIGVLPNLDGRLGLRNIALGISTAYLNFNESICGVPQGLNEVPKAGRSRHG